MGQLLVDDKLVPTRGMLVFVHEPYNQNSWLDDNMFLGNNHTARIWINREANQAYTPWYIQQLGNSNTLLQPLLSATRKSNTATNCQ